MSAKTALTRFHTVWCERLRKKTCCPQLAWAVAVLTFMLAIILIIVQLGKSIDKTKELGVGDVSPSSIYVGSDKVVEYVDEDATNKRREAIASKSPVYFNVDENLSTGIARRMTEAFIFIEEKLANKPVAVPADPKFVRDAYSEIANNTALWAALAKDRRSGWRAEAERQLEHFLEHGIVPRNSDLPGAHEIKLGNNGRYNMEIRQLRDYSDCETASKTFAALLLPSEDDTSTSLSKFFEKLIGDAGNVTKDAGRTKGEQERRVQGVEPIRAEMRPGDLIIKHGDFVNKTILNKLKANYDAMVAADGNASFWPWHRPRLVNVISLLLAMFVTLAGLCLLRDHIYIQPWQVVACGIVSIVVLVLNCFIGNWGQDFCAIKIGMNPSDCATLVLPMAVPFILLTVLCGLKSAVYCGFFTTAVTSLMFVRPDHQLYVLCCSMISGGLCGHLVRRERDGLRFYFGIAAWLWFFTLISSYALAKAIQSLDFKAVGWIVVIALVNAFLSTHVVIALVYLLQWMLKVPTRSYLQMLNNGDHPLYEKMSECCPGTLEHCRNVSFIARKAAQKIGADESLVGACAMYHDIGKLGEDESGDFSSYFTENNSQRAKEMHAGMQPEDSASLIRKHVDYGKKLAEEYGLCSEIIDGIEQHHGDGVVGFFYKKAVEREIEKLTKEKKSEQPSEAEKTKIQREAESQVDVKKFRYAGKKPQSKEMVILSLADACEAAVSGLKGNVQSISKEDIEKKVNEQFRERLEKSEQLREALVTVAELYKIKQSFVESLIGLNRQRIDINAGKDGKTANQLAK